MIAIFKEFSVVLREQHEDCLPGELKGRSLLAMVIVYQGSHGLCWGTAHPLGFWEEWRMAISQTAGWVPQVTHSKLEGKESAHA